MLAGERAAEVRVELLHDIGRHIHTDLDGELGTTAEALAPISEKLKVVRPESLWVTKSGSACP